MNVRQIVTETLRNEGRGNYIGYAEGVIGAIEEQVTEATESLVNFAVRKGLSENEARAAMEEAGLIEPTPVNVAQGEVSEGRLAEALSRIEQTLSGLTSFARQHGYRG